MRCWGTQTTRKFCVGVVCLQGGIKVWRCGLRPGFLEGKGLHRARIEVGDPEGDRDWKLVMARLPRLLMTCCCFPSSSNRASSSCKSASLLCALKSCRLPRSGPTLEPPESWAFHALRWWPRRTEQHEVWRALYCREAALGWGWHCPGQGQRNRPPLPPMGASVRPPLPRQRSKSDLRKICSIYLCVTSEGTRKQGL